MWSLCPALAIVVTFAVTFPIVAAPTIDLDRRTRIVLKITPLDATAAPRTLHATEIDVEAGGTVGGSLNVAWPSAADVSHIDLHVSSSPPTLDGQFPVAIAAELRTPDGRRIHSERAFRFNERATTLFEIDRVDGRSLTLAVEAIAEIETVYSSRRTVGPPVRFRVEIWRVSAGRTIRLEDNFLNSFVGDPVSYGFRLGDGDGATEVTLTLLPVRLEGEIAEVEIEIGGRLPGADGGLAVIGRRERWLASRDAPFKLAFEHGEPPEGYRFVLTTRF